MPETISWNLRLSVRDGKRDELRALINEMVAATRQDEPGAEIYEWFLSEDGSTCHIYERYADDEALMAHLHNFGTKYAERFLGCLEATDFAVYGDPSAEARAVLDGFGASYYEWLAGFKR